MTLRVLALACGILALGACGTSADTVVADSPEREATTGLGVQARPGECVHATTYDPADPAGGAPSREAAIRKVQADKSQLRGVRPSAESADRAERYEGGRRVAAVETESLGPASWYVTSSEFSAPCDYVDPAHLKALRTMPDGVTPGDPAEAAPADARARGADRP